MKVSGGPSEPSSAPKRKIIGRCIRKKSEYLSKRSDQEHSLNGEGELVNGGFEAYWRV